MGLTIATVLVVVSLGVGSSRAALPSDAAGVPFATFARATVAGDYGLACEQFARVTLMRAVTPRPPTLRAARETCAAALGPRSESLDDAQRDRLASTRVVKVRVKPGRARVTVQTELYGLRPRATGTAIVENGRWKIARMPSVAHVGRNLVYRIPSASMLPTLRPADSLLVDPDAYRHARPQIGDIVVFHPPTGAASQRCGKRRPNHQACAKATAGSSAEKFVKRIVAGPGDRVSIRRGHVVRNDQRAGEDFIKPCGHGLDCHLPRTFTVPAGRYYLLGDNRGNSEDSRDWGPVPLRAIIGRVQRLGP